MSEQSGVPAQGSATQGMTTSEDSLPSGSGGTAGEKEYPALGRGVWLVLLRNEWFKARHRLAFIVTFTLFAFINVMEFGGDAWQASRNEERSFGLPDAWGSVFGADSIILVIFASIAVVMLASSEFTWRTARQNVIDGLAKTQWYWGKVIMLGIVAAVFVGGKLAIAIPAAAIGTDFGATATPAIPFSVVVATLGLTLAFLNAGALALFCSVTIRNSGPAMAVWFFWITMAESMLPSMVQRFWPSASTVFEKLPFASAQQLFSFWKYDADTYAAVVARAEAAERAAPELPNMLFWMGMNAGWAVFFVGVGYWWFRRKDL